VEGKDFLELLFVKIKEVVLRDIQDSSNAILLVLNALLAGNAIVN
jgi:hypothetical protein